MQKAGLFVFLNNKNYLIFIRIFNNHSFNAMEGLIHDHPQLGGRGIYDQLALSFFNLIHS